MAAWTRSTELTLPPRALSPRRQRVDPLPRSFLGWIPHVIRTPAKEIMHKNGLDAYVFVRFLFLMMEIFLPLYVVVLWSSSQVS